MALALEQQRGPPGNQALQRTRGTEVSKNGEGKEGGRERHHPVEAYPRRNQTLASSPSVTERESERLREGKGRLRLGNGRERGGVGRRNPVIGRRGRWSHGAAERGAERAERRGRVAIEF